MPITYCSNNVLVKNFSINSGQIANYDIVNSPVSQNHEKSDVNCISGYNDICMDNVHQADMELGNICPFYMKCRCGGKDGL